MAKAAKQWNRDSIRELLRTNAKAVYRGLVVIHALQTADERQSGSTRHSNGVGWSGFDAPAMTVMHEAYKRSGRLTEGQFRYVQRKLHRYAGQLARVANGELKVAV